MYELRRPDPALRPWIEHYWFVRPTPGEPTNLRVEVFVDGRADLLFNFGVGYRREIIGGAAAEIHQSNLDAQRLEPIRITQHGDVRITGVRFELGGVGPFAVGPLRRWTNTTVAPILAFGSAVVDLERDLAADPDPDRQAARLDAFFLARLPPPDGYAPFAVALESLVGSQGGLAIGEIAAAAGVSIRQLERLFDRHLGIAPKTTARILRFQHALWALMRDPGVALAKIAADAGYFDQAHFVREFRRLTGGVPRGYRGYYPPSGPADFAPNVVVFVQDRDPSTPETRPARQTTTGRHTRWASTGPGAARRTTPGS